MTCHWRNSDSGTLLQCMGLTPTFTDDQVQAYAHRSSGGPDDPPYVFWYAMSCLRVNRLIRPDIPEGPCSKFGVNPPSAGAISGGSYASVPNPTGAQVAFGVVSQVAARDPEPISRAIITGIGQIGNFFSGIFSGAPSLQELQAQCQITYGYNAFADYTESALANGTIPLQDALVNLKNAHDSLVQSCAQWPQKDFAPYSLKIALDALYIFNKEVIYPSLAQAQSNGLIAGVSASGSAGKIAIGGAILFLIAKLFGVL